MTLKEEVEQPETDDEKVRRHLQQRREQSRRCDYAESVSNLSKQLTRQSHLTRNKLWKAVRILHREWVRTELPGLCPTLDCSTLQKPTIAP